MAIPIIDERVKHVGATALRGLTAKALKGLEDVMVIQSSDDEPLAVVLPYSIYLEIQQALWPASIIPSLETVFGPAAPEPNGGVETNPDMEHSLESFSVIGVDDTPRGAKFARVDDSKPPVFDDIDEPPSPPALPHPEPVFSSTPIEDVVTASNPVCDHCGNPSDKPLCPTCFVAGHRNGNCLICGELEQSKL